MRVQSLGREDPRRKWQPTPAFLPGESHGQKSLVGYSPWDSRRVGHDLVAEHRLPKVLRLPPQWAASSKSRESFPFLRIWHKSRENGSSVHEAAWDAEARRSGRLRGPCF